MEKKLTHQNHQNKDTFNLKWFKEGFTKDKQRKLAKLERKEDKILAELDVKAKLHNESLSKKEKKTKKKKSDKKVD